MGLFDGLMSKKEVQLSPKGALTLAAITMIAADGSVDDEELTGLRRIAQGDEALFQSVLRVYKEKSVEESVAIVAKTLNADQRLAAMAVLLDLAMADGVLAGAEERLATTYMGAFQIREDQIKPIVAVLALKNDLAKFEG